MALISESEGRKDGNSGFARLFGNAELGALLSSVHAAVIRGGYELENALREAVDAKSLLSLEETLSCIQQSEQMRLPAHTFAFKGRGSVRSLGYESHADRT
jgi:hypothetical protein